MKKILKKQNVLYFKFKLGTSCNRHPDLHRTDPMLEATL